MVFFSIKSFVWIKERIPHLWQLLEFFLGVAFFWKYKGLRKVIIKQSNFISTPYTVRLVRWNDLADLRSLCLSLEPEKRSFFEPHPFDFFSLSISIITPSFQMIGVFYKKEMVGYGLLKCYPNSRCFIGRLVAKNYRRKGIGRVLNEVLYNSSWSANFRLFSTISKENLDVIHSHQGNRFITSKAELGNGYYLIEFSKNNVIM